MEPNAELGLTNNIDTPNGWRRINPVLQGWLFAVRKPYPNGSHVAVFVACVSGKYDVVVETEHGTLLPDVNKAGTVGSLSEAMQLLQKTCRSYDDDYKGLKLSEPAEIKKWFYSTDAGIKGPVDREQLFELLESNAVEWDTQVILECHGIGSVGLWDPLVKVLGIPMPLIANSPDKLHVEWFGWICQFIYGAFIGILIGSYLISQYSVLHSYTVFIVFGLGLIYGAIATQLGPRRYRIKWMYPQDQPQPNQTMKRTTLSIGIAGLLILIGVGMRLLAFV